MSIGRYERTVNSHQLLAEKFAELGAHIVKVRIGANLIDKCFLQYCPNCKSKLPLGLHTGRVEACRAPECSYCREISSWEEWQAIVKI
jgi:hypothetical protein